MSVNSGVCVLGAAALQQRPPLAPGIARHFVAVDPEQVERDERDRDRGVPVQHTLNDERRVGRFGAERD